MGTGNSLIFLFAERSVTRAASWQFAYLFICRTKRGESSGSLQFAYSQNEAKREQRPCNSLIRYSQNEAKREQRPGNSLILYIILEYILNKIKKRPRAWTPGRFCEVASHGKAFFFYFL